MPKYIAFQTRYVERLLSDDGTEHHLPPIDYLPYQAVMIHDRDPHFFTPDPVIRADLEINKRDIPDGSVVFARKDLKPIGFKAMELYDHLMEADYCHIYARGDITEYDDIVVVECHSESG